MSYSAKAADLWIAEQQHEIERQHREITELNGRLADALNFKELYGNVSYLDQRAEDHRIEAENQHAKAEQLKADMFDLTRAHESTFTELETTIDGLASAITEEEERGDRLSVAIALAIEDLRVLPEVSTLALASCIEAIAERLRGVL